jgi:hypothetical protein
MRIDIEEKGVEDWSVRPIFAHGWKYSERGRASSPPLSLGWAEVTIIMKCTLKKYKK